MVWFKKSKAPIKAVENKTVQMPEGLWIKCQNCSEIIYAKEIERNLNVCPKCDYHFRISARARIDLVLDKGSFVEMDADMESTDFLDFKDSKKYKDRIKTTLAKSGGGDAVVCGEGAIEGLPVVVSVFDFSFMGGSMGSVVGEKITRAIEKGLENRTPVIVFSCFRRRAYAGKHSLFDADGQNQCGSGKTQSSWNTVCLCAHGPHHRWGYRKLCHARRYQHDRAACPDRLCRPSGY